MNAVGWAKLPGTAIMIAWRRAILPTRVRGEVAPRGHRAGTPCPAFALRQARCPPYKIAQADSNLETRPAHPSRLIQDRAFSARIFLRPASEIAPLNAQLSGSNVACGQSEE
jgi:hypothetical protein